MNKPFESTERKFRTILFERMLSFANHTHHLLKKEVPEMRKKKRNKAHQNCWE